MKNKKGAFKRLIKEIFKHYPVLFTVSIFFIIFNAMISSIPGIFIQKIIHIVESAGPNDTWQNLSKSIIYLIVILLSLDLISLIFSIVYNQIMAVITQGTLYRIRYRMFENLQNLPIKYYDSESHGDIMSYFTNDTDTLRQMLSQSLPQVISSFVIVVMVFSIMLYYSLWLTLVALLGVFAMFYSSKYIGGNSRKFFVDRQKKLAKTEGFIEEMIHGQKVIKIFNREQEVTDNFNEVNDELFKVTYKANSYSNILIPVIAIIGNILYVLVAIAGGILVLYNIPNVSFSGMAIGVSIVVPFLNMTKQFAGNINQVSMQINSIIMGLAGVERIMNLLDEEPEIDNGTVHIVKKDGKTYFNDSNNLTEIKGKVEIKNVVFGYEEDKTILKNITINAKSGERLALVGATGSGKTTIANLINRFYDVNSGEILIDGINVNNIIKDDLRHNIGVVLQDTNLFTGTVMENLKYGNLKATDEECIEACKKTGAHYFIMKLPEQYQTVIKGGGDSLSQGQVQLLGLSRSLLEDKPILILDEATSSIDTRTEQVVQKAMDVLMKGRTVFIIAHRLSTIANSDTIIVLDNGEILEQGNHDELIEKQGRYYQLYTGKFELE